MPEIKGIELCTVNSQTYVCTVDSIMEPMESNAHAIERVAELAKQEPEVVWTDPDTEIQYNFASIDNKNQYTGGPRTPSQWELIQTDWGTNNLFIKKGTEMPEPPDPINP